MTLKVETRDAISEPEFSGKEKKTPNPPKTGQRRYDTIVTLFLRVAIISVQHHRHDVAAQRRG